MLVEIGYYQVKTVSKYTISYKYNTEKGGYCFSFCTFAHNSAIVRAKS